MIPLDPLTRVAGVAVMAVLGARSIYSRRRSDRDLRTGMPADPPVGDAGAEHGSTDPGPDEDWTHPARGTGAGGDEPIGPWLNLFGRDLRRANLSNLELVCADLRRARLSGRHLAGRDLTGALMTGASLDRAILRDAQLAGVDLDWASLRGADLSGADLNGASLVEADLGGADLSGADLSGARNLASAVLRGAHASRKTRWPVDFDPILAGVVVDRR